MLLLASFYHVLWASVPFIPGTVKAHGRTLNGFPPYRRDVRVAIAGRKKGHFEDKDHIETRAFMVAAHSSLLPFMSLPSPYLIRD